jgi:putative ABC transport system ATP-binding protein
MGAANMTTGALVLQGRGVGKVFGKGDLAFRALKPTDLDVALGQVLVIRGPSGSGKTTLLSILGLVLTPTEGEVIVNGKSAARMSPDELASLRRDQVGFVFQQFNLLPSLDAEENAAIPLLLAGASSAERRRRSLEALELVGMKDKRASTPRALSGGQQQRVAVARALVAGAPILLCDEPTASLDGATGQAILALLRGLARDHGRAVVIVTHDDRVLQYADRVVHVVDGQVRA